MRSQHRLRAVAAVLALGLLITGVRPLVGRRDYEVQRERYRRTLSQSYPAYLQEALAGQGTFENVQDITVENIRFSWEPVDSGEATWVEAGDEFEAVVTVDAAFNRWPDGEKERYLETLAGTAAKAQEAMVDKAYPDYAKYDSAALKRIYFSPVERSSAPEVTVVAGSTLYRPGRSTLSYYIKNGEPYWYEETQLSAGQ